MNVKKISTLFVLGAFVLIGLFSIEARPAHADSMAYWRLVHASPDISSADVYVDGVKLASNFQFGTVTNYIPTPAGTHKIQVVIVGQSIGAAVMTQMVTVNPNEPYTLAILGSKPSDFALSVFQDNNTAPTNGAKIRAYDLSPDAGAINLAVGNNTLVSNLTYAHASDYVNIQAGAYTFDVTTTQPMTTLPDSATLNEGSLTSVFTVGMLSGNPKIRVVSSKTAIMPGMPQTGSDPYAQTQVQAAPLNSQPTLPLVWLLGILALAGIAGSVLLRFHKVGSR